MRKQVWIQKTVKSSEDRAAKGGLDILNDKMYMSIPISSGEIVLGRESMNYQRILDDFPNAKQVRILTYNISKNQYRNELMNALNSIKEDVDVKIISNIPSRMPTYYSTPAGEAMRRGYRSNFTAYLERLNPENFPSNPEVSFNFSNHAKIIGTENVLYVGSANYSDESCDNIESGTIITDKNAIKKIFDEFFPAIIDESIPYFDDGFNVFRLFVLSMKAKFEKWLSWFDDRLVWSNPNTGERSINDYFQLDWNGLLELNSNIEELNSFVVHLENTYSEDDESYNTLIDKMLETYKTISISWMIDFTTTDSEFYEFIVFDEEVCANDILQEDLEAYDEYLNDCADRAMSSAHEQYTDMHNAIENDVLFLRDQIEKVVYFLDRVHKRTVQYANKWIVEKVDNT